MISVMMNDNDFRHLGDILHVLSCECTAENSVILADWLEAFLEKLDERLSKQRKRREMKISDPFDGYPSNVAARFKSWHGKNPHIYQQFKVLAYKMRATGRQRYSARTIMEVMRWHYDLKTQGDVFEVNDNFTPIYVRLLIHDHPEFDGFFELRMVRSRGVISDEQWRRENEEEEYLGSIGQNEANMEG